MRYSLYNLKNYNTTLEVLWNILPILCLGCIAVPSFSLLYFIDDASCIEFIIKVMGNQWYWTYEYNLVENGLDFVYSFDSRLLLEEDLMKENKGFRLLEVDQRLSLLHEVYISFLISASDVLHSWAIPSLGIKCDACPGRLNQVICYINRIGVYYGQCSEICGLFHAFMPIVINVDADILEGLSS